MKGFHYSSKLLLLDEVTTVTFIQEMQDILNQRCSTYAIVRVDKPRKNSVKLDKLNIPPKQTLIFVSPLDELLWAKWLLFTY